MNSHPWRSAGVSRAAWEKAQKGVIGLVADLVWRARGRSRSGIRIGVDEPMQRLSAIGRGDPDATRYGLDLADSGGRDRA